MKMENFHCEPCKERDKNKTATHWCVICEEALCLECTEHHRVQKMSRSHELLDINIKPTHINISDQRCSKHENLPFEYFCVDHDSLCCKECQVESHRSCQKVMSVDIASKGINRSQSFIDSVECIQHVLMTVPIITADRQTLIDSIEKDANVIRDEIRKVKEEAISHIEYLEKLLLEELKLKKDKIVTNAKGLINEIENIKRMTKEEKDKLDIVEKHGSEKQAFLAIHANKRVLTDFENRVRDITETTSKCTIKLNTKSVKKTTVSIGIIETIEVPSAIEFVQKKKQQSQFPVEQTHGLSSFGKMQSILDTGLYGSILGMTLNDKDEIICSRISMFENGAEIAVYDNRGNFKNGLRTENEKLQIAFIPGKNKGVITFYSEHFIQFVDFGDMKLLNKVSMTGYSLGAVVASNQNLFIGTNGKILVLDLKGSYIRSIKIIENLIPSYISLDTHGNIYYSHKNAVYCIKINGDNLFTYKQPENKRLHGVAVDSQGYVYVVVKNLGVCRLKPDGMFSDLVVNEDLDEPFKNVCFNKDCTKLYISKEECVLVYTRQ